MLPCAQAPGYMTSEILVVRVATAFCPSFFGLEKENVLRLEVHAIQRACLGIFLCTMGLVVLRYMYLSLENGVRFLRRAEGINIRRHHTQ